MGHIKIDQQLTLTLDTDETITGAKTANVIYKDPNGNTGTWSGSVSGTDGVQVSIPASDLTEAKIGRWYVYADVVKADGSVCKGEVNHFDLRAEWFYPKHNE